MRNVLKSGEVFHYFANKVQPSGRAGNISFALPRAYSYAAVIGKHFPDGVALSSSTRSVTTTGHQSDLRQACNHLTRIYVPDPDSVETSFRAVNINVQRLLEKASVAKARKDSYLGDALRQVADFNKFAQWNGSTLHIDAPVTDPAALADIAKAVKAENAKRNTAIKERQRIDALSDAEKIAAWRNGEQHWFKYSDDAYLRVNGDNVETSKGANIPASDALKLWPIILRCKNGQKEYTPGMALGNYRLTQIKSNGDIVVGCHNICFAEIEQIAKKLGVAK